MKAIESNLQIVNSGNLSALNPNHVDVSDTQDMFQNICFWKFEY